jgi:hypothetical protein
MKSKLFLTFALLLLLGVLPSRAQTGPFCPDCTTIQLEHMTKAEFDLWYNNTYFPLFNVASNKVAVAVANALPMGSNAWNIYNSLENLYNAGMLDWLVWNDLQPYFTALFSQIDVVTFNLFFLQNDLKDLNTSVLGVTFTNSTFCVTCTSTGGETGLCCLCPDCEASLQSIPVYCASVVDYLNTMKNDLASLKIAFDAYYVKWQAQDEKLQPLIDELKPMLANIKKYYDDYYASDWTSATWNNEKKIFDDIVQADLIAKWGRFFGDYASSSFSDLSWSALSGSAVALDYSLNSGLAEGKEGLKWLLYDYNAQKGAPYASFDTLGDVGESDYKHLNWFQKVAVSLGIIAYGVTNNNHTTLDYDSLKNGASDAGASVTSFASTFSGKVGACGNSFKNIFQSFAGIFPADRLPTQIQIHSGMNFSLGQGQDAQVVPPLYWVLSDNPAFVSVLGTLRGFFGVIWWLVGIIVIYKIVMGCASFIGGIVVRVLGVLGSLGKSGGGDA